MFKFIPGVFFKINNKKVLDKTHQRLEVVPDDLFRYAKCLEELILDNNYITNLEPKLFTLHRLKKLGLGWNELEEIPEDIRNLENLVELNLSRNKLNAIPDEIMYLKLLELLDVQSNPIEKLPDGFCELTNLKILILSDLILSELPDNFGNLVNLEHLQIRENQLYEIPDSLSSLKKLQVLDLAENNIDEIPSFIGELSLLHMMLLETNVISEIPPEIGQLKCLTYLDLSNNKIEVLPEEIFQLENLTDLHLSNNLLVRIPSEIKYLKSLEVVRLDSNQIVVIDDGFGECINVQELNLTANYLKCLPSSLGRMTKLCILNADNNKLEQLPMSIGDCTSLGVLSCRKNKLTELPKELVNCKNLRILDVSANKLNHLPYSLTQLDLKAIWLYDNQSKPLPNFQHDYIGEEKVLTCVMLPQQDYTPVSKSSSQLSERKIFKTPTVRFSESDSDEEPRLVRKKTPYHKDLKARAARLFGLHKNEESSSVSEQGNVDAVSIESQTASSSTTTIPIEEEIKTDDSLVSESESKVEEPLHKITIHTTVIKDLGRGLGFTIAPGEGKTSKCIYISQIIHGSRAQRDNKIKVGDMILAINGNDMTIGRYKDAKNLLSSPDRFVRLMVQREVPFDSSILNITLGNGTIICSTIQNESG